MKLICLAGQDEIKDISRLKRKIKKRARAEGHNYLWDKYKPLIKVNGKYAIEYVLDAINDSHSIDNAVIIGKYKLKKIIRRKNREKKISFAEQGKSYEENIRKGYDALKIRNKQCVMVITADLPLITGKIIDNANKKYAKQLNADFIVPVVERKTLGTYPREYFPAYDNLFKNEKRDLKEANFYYITGNANFHQIGKFFDIRKLMETGNRIKLLAYILQREGLVFLGIVPAVFYFYLRYGAIKLSYAEKHASRIFGCKVRFIESVFPEFSMDMDSKEDLRIIESTMKKR
jgi:GTP:adenosylcobinamide-phosphate guanylyltransferase